MNAIIIYETDCWHSHSSQTLIGIATTEKQRDKIIKQYLRTLDPKPNREEVQDVMAQIHSMGQTQCLSEVFDVEINTETVTLNEGFLFGLEKQKEQKPVEKEITLTNFEETLNTFLFDFANSPIEDCEPKEYIKKHSAEILKAAYKELNAQLQQDIFAAQQEGRREGYEAARAEEMYKEDKQ